MREEKNASRRFKETYLDGIERLIERRNGEYLQKRNEYARDIFENQSQKREDFKKMLGYPLVGYEKNEIPNVKTEKLGEEEDCAVYRMSFEITDNVWMSGLLFKKDEEKRPMVIVQHGGQGTPELISGLYGDTGNYNDMLKRVIKYGVNAFAPQLLIWSREEYELDFDRAVIDARLKRVGSSITALEVFGITRIIDWFETQTYVKNFGMVGLSYGGFYTLFTAAADERIKSAIACSQFSDRTKYSWVDWTWENASEKFGDAEIACLVYPRRLCVEMGKSDDLFDWKFSAEEFERVKALSAAVGVDWVDFIAFDGNHEFCREDFPIERLVCDLLSE